MNNEIPQLKTSFPTITTEKFIVGRITEQIGSGLDKQTTNYYIGEPELKFKNGNVNDPYPTLFGSRERANKFDTYPAAAEMIKTLAPGMYCIDKIFIVAPASQDNS
jgi:hypothetical protein